MTEGARPPDPTEDPPSVPFAGVRLPRFSRFERRILAAVTLVGLAPFLISLVFIPRIVEQRFALSVHEQVRTQLEASAVFYKEFFDSKKREFSARAEATARDPILTRALEQPTRADLESRLDQLIADHSDLAVVRVFGPDGDLWVERVGIPPERRSGYSTKTLTLPIGVGRAPRLELEFGLPARYIEDRNRAEQIAVLYGTALAMGTDFQRAHFYTYVLLTSAALILSLAGGFVLARQVTRRIALVALGTQRVAAGELDFSIEAKGRDEITSLTHAFNRMVGEVKSARDRIVYLEKVSGWQDFARRLAHEIKNPLTPIQLAMHELRRRAPRDDAAFAKLVDDIVEMVEEEIAALTRLVDEFSQFARLPEVVPQRVELRGFVEDLLHAYNRFEPDADVELELPAEPVFADIDRVLMRRALSNLVTNAIQATSPRRVKLAIRCRRDGARILLEVEDDGPGIPADHVARIFDPYFTTKKEGTGLGLAIVKKTVLQHGGTIEVGAGRAGGARFVIELPAPSDLQTAGQAP